jgi:prepilin peptidase CpaA
MTPQVWVAIVIGIAATVEDLARRQVSNWICGAALIAGFGLQITSAGWRGGVSALLGAITGFSVFFIFHLLGGMGGGDVKLMAGFGAVLGVKRLLEAALWTAACGGVFAALAIGFSALRGLLCVWMRSEPRTGPAAARQRRLQSIPYAPAIAAGVWLSLLPKT